MKPTEPAGDSLAVVDMLLKDNVRRVAAERDLVDVRTWMDLAQEVGGVATYKFDVVENRLSWSPSVFQLYGLSGTTGEPSLALWLSTIHPEDRNLVERAARAAIEEGCQIDQHFRVVVPGTGEIRWIHDRGRVHSDEHGTPVLVLGVNVDVTAARRSHAVLAESEQTFRATFERANVGVAHVSLEGRFLRANTSLCRLLGRSAQQLSNLTFQEVTHEDDLDKDLHLLRQVLAGERDTYTMEKRYKRGDGEIVWADLSVSVLRDQAGQPLHFVSVVSDIHERKQAQEQVQLVLGEAGHRVKNLLAVVSAVVGNTARTAQTVLELRDGVDLRLRGIAASHDLLMGKTASGGQMEQLIQRQLEVFTSCEIDRVEISGPAVDLNPQAVHAFGMIIHELATNACKYGALSGSAGRVLIRWSIEPDTRLLQFEWREQGGPAVEPVTRRGFGTRALQRTLSGAIGGSSIHHFDRAGVRFEAKAPLDKVVSSSVRPAGGTDQFSVV